MTLALKLHKECITKMTKISIHRKMRPARNSVAKYQERMESLNADIVTKDSPGHLVCAPISIHILVRNLSVAMLPVVVVALVFSQTCADISEATVFPLYHLSNSRPLRIFCA